VRACVRACMCVLACARGTKRQGYGSPIFSGAWDGGVGDEVVALGPEGGGGGRTRSSARRARLHPRAAHGTSQLALQSTALKLAPRTRTSLSLPLSLTLSHTHTWHATWHVPCNTHRTASQAKLPTCCCKSQGGLRRRARVAHLLAKIDHLGICDLHSNRRYAVCGMRQAAWCVSHRELQPPKGTAGY
jgi:hypothetical protein